jgi:integrase
MAAARACPDPRDRLVIELLARTGMRAGELADLEADAVVRIGDGHWLRIPLGKLRNDRYVSLHPQLTELLAAWTASNLAHIRYWRRLVADHRGPSTASRSAASSAGSAAAAASASTPTSCATPPPPRPSTAACGWRRSPRSCLL